MGNIRSRITLEETPEQIERKILKALQPDLEKYLNKAFQKVQPKIEKLVQDAIVRSPEYQSILSGTLKYEFGLPDSQSRLIEILDFWKRIEAKYQPIKITQKNDISGGFTLGMIKSDYSDVLNSTGAHFTTKKGVTLDWLEWLLLFGNRTIIKDYVVKFGRNRASRTGNAIMTGKSRGKWSVPAEFSGTQNNNWITRAIDSIDKEFDKLIVEALK
jgi:hypothetical protein